MNKKPNLNDVMDDVATYVAAINGMKQGLINEGWDPKNAEDITAAQFVLGAKSQCRVCGHDPREG